MMDIGKDLQAAYDDGYKQGQIDTIKRFCNITPPKTNADRIRAMTDEELATFLGFTLQDGYCYGAGLRKELKFIPVSEHNEMVEWLKKEVDDAEK